MLKLFEGLEKSLLDLVKHEAELFRQTRWLQVVRDSAHALWELFSLHKFPNDVSYRFFDSDHQRLLYPTTIVPASQHMAGNMTGICNAVETITKEMSPPQAAMFLQTLTYLVLSAVVMGARRSRLPAVAAFAYVQAAERGLGLELLGEAVGKEFERRLRAAIEALKIDWGSRNNDLQVAEAFTAAKDLLPGKPSSLASVAAAAE